MGREGFDTMNDDRISDELLNAYVDDELDAEERRRIEEAIEGDSHLRGRIEELRELKRFVRMAYMDQAPARPAVRRAVPWRVSGLAASLAAFALGVALTWGWFSYTGGMGAPGMASAPESSGATVAATEQPVRVVFHLSHDDPGRLEAILNEAHALLETTARNGHTAKVRVIASGEGLSLFERDRSPMMRRISEMKRAYSDQVFFNGCGVAYKQLKEQRPEETVELLPEVKLVDLGVLELMRRQRDGWAYIRI